MIIEGFDKKILENKKLYLVCGSSFDRLGFANDVKCLQPVRFGNFTPNPRYEDVMAGVDAFNKSGCDTILAIGGGSAIDVAKCIKFYSNSNAELIAIPTTSGSGSEATHFAVIYKDGTKLSVSDDRIRPTIVVLEPSVLIYVSDYIRKTTMLDALCHAIESYWSKKSREESRKLAAKAIKEIIQYKEQYLKNEIDGNAGMLHAANLAGQAIDITTTTAAHAMSYKLTSLYGIAHGHAAALCLPEVWKINKSRIPGITLDEFDKLYAELKLERPVRKCDNDIELLTNSVNVERLKNNPVDLDTCTIHQMYERIVV